MTSAPMGDYEPAQSHGELGPDPAPERGNGATAGSVTDQAAQVGQSAKESGKQVASTASDEATKVTAEARRQAKDLSHEVGNQAQQQAAIGKDKAAGGLRSLGEELRSMAQRGGQSGPATDLAHEAADKVTDLAAWLERRDPGALLEEVRGLARRKPGTFLLGAAAAGVVAGRLTRGAVQANNDDTVSTSSGDSTETGRQDVSAYGADVREPNGRVAPFDDEPTPIADMTAAETNIGAAEPATAPAESSRWSR